MAKPPEFPFQDVAVDLFYLNGKCFLVYVDRMSFWFEVTRFTSDPSSTQVIQALRRWFATFGIPVRLRADNELQFRFGEFSSFLDEHSVQLSLTSPFNPRSNGLAESAVKSAKLLLLRTSSAGREFWRNRRLIRRNSVALGGGRGGRVESMCETFRAPSPQ
eukprot:snap_masked-scaffold574_size133225-processed-gene-0.9 protein:Tk07452 transcript:snap_masked-scaffold574_size133225-processed-gene-0.9-mRNA-1 annotation:"PREDICTED: uncharacterized protein K02A2.6-like"